ncbi:hypothetical protein VTJ83DRAFT_2226 [Remersonia thermophila]|uniref:Fibronectin type-III domain-containing protein n=1 Tax=Remersonia thermophila TaxID=72144 RepID=A0ABR4DIE8_9PEZI
MSWISWTSLVSTLLVLSASLAWWFAEPKTARILLAAAGAALVFWAVAPELCRHLSTSAYVLVVDALAASRLHLVLLRHFKMLIVGIAVGWLARRAWQTLWKPVPELINILGVDVPDPPDVSLAEIRADAATIHWTRAPANRSVQKFLIQVNGVVVGEVAANQEPAIVVSGLKPDHFYNVRVIAVNSNNFQAGSRVIRLRTFGRDGRPCLGNARLPSNFVADEHPRGATPSEAGDDSGTPRSPFPALEVPTIQEPAVASPCRDGNATAGQQGRRNTVTRRHSPSTASLDQQQQQHQQHQHQHQHQQPPPPPRDEANAADAEQSLPELTEKFEGIRKETEDVLAQIAKEEGDNKLLMEELEAEKQEKRREQKKKEEQTERLRKDVHATDRTMRNAMQRKVQREKALKEKQNERAKLHDSIAKWEKSVGEMRKERESFARQMAGLEEERDQKVEQAREENGDLQAECSRLEAELREKREQVKELEAARKLLPGGDEDGEWREKLSEERREWYRSGVGRELQEITTLETKRGRSLDEQLRILTIQVQQIPLQHNNHYAMYGQAGAPGLGDGDHAAATAHLARRSRPPTSVPGVPVPAPLPVFSQIDSTIAAAPAGFASARSANAPPGFAPNAFMDHAEMARLDEFSLRTAPLSPSATALLPSNLMADLDDDEDDGPGSASRFPPESFLAQPQPPAPAQPQTQSQPQPQGQGQAQAQAQQPRRSSPDHAPQSPASSGKSPSIFASPHGSSSHLPFPPFQNDVANTMSSPVSAEPASNNKLSGFFPFQRSRHAKTVGQEGIPFGSLKPGQSQSFPKQGEDLDGFSRRRISLTGGWAMFNRNSVGPEMGEVMASAAGTAPAPAPAAAAAAPGSRTFGRGLSFFGSHRPPGGLLPDRDQSSPRPESIASAELPRPSTDSSSIWGPQPGDLGKNRLWSPNAWSREPSRRPSLQGSPSALETSLASADDEILGEEMLPNVNEVGVIGSRPPNQSRGAGAGVGAGAGGRLNPNAPAFNIASLFKSNKPEKDKEKEGKEKSGKADKKDKAKSKEGKDKKAREPTSPEGGHNGILVDLDSPLEPRRSRDGLSVRTQTSTTTLSESRDSLSLEMSFSNAPSEAATSSASGAPLSSSFKEESNVVRKLFRKGSSSKFTITGRLSISSSSGDKGSSNPHLGGNDSDNNNNNNHATNNLRKSKKAPSSTTSRRESMGDLESVTDAGGEEGATGFSNNINNSSSSGNNTNSPVLGKNKESKARWLSNFGKKGRREKESLDPERSKEVQQQQGTVEADGLAE